MTDLNRDDFELLKALKRSVVEIEESETPSENDAVPGVKRHWNCCLRQNLV